MKNYLKKIPLLLALLVFVFLFIAFIFLYGKINSNNQEAEQDATSWQTEASRREEIVSLRFLLQKIADNKTELESHFIKSANIVPFFDTIGKLATEAKVENEISSVDTGENNSGLIVGLKASGSFESVYKFLTLLENSPYELDFLSMDLHKLTTPDVPDKNKNVVKIAKWEAVFRIQLLSFIP